MDLKSKKINIDVDTISVLYKQYREYFLPIGIILASFLILFFIVIPQTQQFLTNSDVLKTEEQKLEILKNNDNFLTNLDEVKIDNQLSQLSAVLPSSKDFAGVLNAISGNASKTNVSVGDFEFVVGDLSAPKDVSINPPLNLKVTLQGDTASIVNFINELYKTVPIADIDTLQLDSGTLSIAIAFYYKPFPVQNISDEQPIIALSPQANALITQVSSWNNSVSQSQLPLIPNLSPNAAPGTSSSSGSTNPQPF